MEPRNFERERAIVLAALTHLAQAQPIPETVQREISPFRTYRLRREDIEFVRDILSRPAPQVDELLGNVTLEDALALAHVIHAMEATTRAKEGVRRRLSRFVNRILGLLQQPQPDSQAS